MSEPRNGPRGLPELRAHLLAEWQPGRPFTEGTAARRVLKAGGVALDNEKVGAWERDCLSRAALWWVGDEMTDLLDAAAPSIPGVALTEPTMPSLDGLVRFAHPLRGLDAEHNTTLSVDAMQWGPIVLPPRPGGPRRGTPGIGIACYRRVTAELLIEDLRLQGDERQPGAIGLVVSDPTRAIWVPLGRADWCFGDQPDDRAFLHEVTAGEMGAAVEEVAHLSMVEDRRRMLALWVLSAQPGVATSYVDRGDRAERRRAERHGLPVPDVQVINLRRPAPKNEGEGLPVHWSHRWIVSGHWRNQAVGPGRTERRPTWVTPHVKGPADKPLADPTKVHSWTR